MGIPGETFTALRLGFHSTGDLMEFSVNVHLCINFVGDGSLKYLWGGGRLKTNQLLKCKSLVQIISLWKNLMGTV